jgi:hypothetical protein
MRGRLRFGRGQLLRWCLVAWHLAWAFIVVRQLVPFQDHTVLSFSSSFSVDAKRKIVSCYVFQALRNSAASRVSIMATLVCEVSRFDRDKVKNKGAAKIIFGL